MGSNEEASERPPGTPDFSACHSHNSKIGTVSGPVCDYLGLGAGAGSCQPLLHDRVRPHGSSCLRMAVTTGTEKLLPVARTRVSLSRTFAK